MEPNAARPTRLLPIGDLVRLSIYWLGLVAVINGVGIILQERIKTIVPDPGSQYTTLGIVQVVGIVVAIIVQPTIGSISDYTVSRFGRRKPYILIGTTLDLVFLIGLATSNTVLSLAAFVTLLQFSSNFAQGPFQGYIPDLVPAPQVGLASAMVGMFTVLGAVIGTAFATLGLAIGDFLLPTISDSTRAWRPTTGAAAGGARSPPAPGERTSSASEASRSSSARASSSSAGAPSSSFSPSPTSSDRSASQPATSARSGFSGSAWLPP